MRKLEQYDLAKELGVSSAYISHLENGRRNPSYEVARRAAGFFHDDEAYVMGKACADNLDNFVRKLVVINPQGKSQILREAMNILLVSVDSQVPLAGRGKRRKAPAVNDPITPPGGMVEGFFCEDDEELVTPVEADCPISELLDLNGPDYDRHKEA